MNPRGREPAPLPAPFSTEPFTRRAALAAGLNDDRLRRHDLSRPFYGIRMLSSAPSDLVTLARAYRARMNPAHAFSHTTAATLYGIPLPRYASAGTVLEVSAPRELRRPRGAGIVGHDIASDLWMTQSLVLRPRGPGDLAEFPIVAPELAWAQLATVLDERDLVAVADALVTLSTPGVGADGPLCSVESLRNIVQAYRGRRGVAALAKAVGRVRVGALSRPESLLRLMMVEAGLPDPELNVVVPDARGKPIVMCDLVWLEYRTVVEYEGDHHRTSAGKFLSDIDRFGMLADAKWVAHRAHRGHVFGDPNPFLARVARSLAAAGWRPPRRGLAFVSPARR